MNEMMSMKSNETPKGFSLSRGTCLDDGRRERALLRGEGSKE